MKKYVFFLMVLFFTVGTKISAQVQWGVKAGGNLSSMLFKDEGGYLKVKLHPGFHVGGTADVILSENFSLQPGLLFTTKGFETGQDTRNFDIEGVDRIKFTSYHIELPVNLIFRPQAGNGRMLLGVGPYVSYGLGGRWKAEADNVSIKGKLDFLNDLSDMDSTFGGNGRTIPYLKPFDFGANILIGYELSNNLYFHINGQLGLINVDPSLNGIRDESSSAKTVQGGLSIGYKF